MIGSVVRNRSRQEKCSQRERLYVCAALAVESISIRAGVSRSRGGAKGCGTYSSANVFDFLLTQGTSASAEQYPVYVIHTFISFRDFGPRFAKQHSATLTRSRTRLTAEFANVLISIRRRRAGAEGESSKSSIDDFRFCGCQFASTPANQYSVLVVHFFSFHQLGPLQWAQVFKICPSAWPRRGFNPLAFTDGSISIPVVRSLANGAECEGTEASINDAYFLLGQLTSPVAAEYAIFLVHTFTPSCDTF
jgi:hypothetical protein